MRPVSQRLDEEVESIAASLDCVSEGTSRPIRIQLLHVPDCPNLGELRRRLQQSVTQLGVSAVIEEIEGPYPSPTLLVNGDDVTGRPLGSDPSCRLDSPTHEQIMAAITRTAAKTDTRRATTAPSHVRKGAQTVTTPHADQQTVEPAGPTASAATCGRALCGWSPTSLPADTSLKRAADIVRVGNVAAVGVLVVVIGLLNLAPHLAHRPGLVVDGLAALVAGGWCSLNFWRCRHAHCLVTGPGWLALGVFAFIEAGVGRSVIGGNEQPVFLAVLVVALAFEGAWYLGRHTNAVM